MTQTALAALELLYQDLKIELKKLKTQCRQCGQCCDFAKQDYLLFASNLELQYFFLQTEKQQIKPGKTSPGRCPYQDENQCCAHQMRPLGCRIFFCTANSNSVSSQENTLETLSSQFHNRLQQIHNKHLLEWNYRPFLDTLERYSNELEKKTEIY